MPKTTAQDIKHLGFARTLYADIVANDTDFLAFIDSIIAEQAAILEGRIGSPAYASTTPPSADYVKRAEKCLAAAEMVQRRINIIMNNVVGSGEKISVENEVAQRKAYLDEAGEWIGKLSQGVTTDSADFAMGALVTSHFGEADA